MKQKRNDMLAISFACPSTVEVGDVVIINSAKAVIKNNAAGSLKIVGTVCVHRADALTCTVETRFREHRDDRVSGAAISAVGPFVFDAAGKVIAYSAASHDPASIAGLVITTAGGADVVVETLEF
jgi:hypothetical protein